MRVIKPTNNHGTIQLRFSVQGHRYTLHPIPGAQYSDPGDLERVKAIAEQIALDVRRDIFDPTLERYRPQVIVAPVKPGRGLSLIDLWDKWVDTLGLSADTRACHYQHVRRMMLRAKPVPEVDDASWFTDAASTLAASTHNIRLRCLRKCLEWAVGQGLATANPYKRIKTKTVRVVPVKPFSLNEIARILGDFGEHHPAYVPFVAFLFMVGCRTSEAVGLRWECINFDRGELSIEDSLPISAATGKPERKGTKTGSVTVLDLTDELRALLASIGPRAPDDLIFRSPKGCIINRRNFRADAWKPCLERLGIPYRKPHTTRHTMASHAIDQGASLVDVAYLLGHRDTTMVAKTYGRMVNRPKLPSVVRP
jgi:integrase